MLLMRGESSLAAGNVHGENSLVRESPFHLAEKLYRRKVKRNIDLLRVGIDNDDVVFSFSQVHKDPSILVEYPHRVDKGEVGPSNLYHLWVYFHAVNANLRIKIVDLIRYDTPSQADNERALGGSLEQERKKRIVVVVEAGEDACLVGNRLEPYGIVVGKVAVEPLSNTSIYW